MDYAKLLGRAWNIIWEHKFLIFLGILVALGSSSSGGSLSGSSRSLPGSNQEWHMTVPPGWRGTPGPSTQEVGMPVVTLIGALVLVGIALVLALAVWVVSTLARGALIAGASAVDAGSATNFGEAFAAARQRGWTLLGIGAFPAIPALILLLGALSAAFMYFDVPPVINGLDRFAGPRNVALVLGALTCAALPLVIVLNVLRTFANRACVLEGCGVFAAYGRGLGVLGENIGSALILFLIQVGIGLAMGLALLLPALCCVLWPVLLLVQGAATSFFSTAWTLAWRQWTDAVPAVDEALAV